MFALWTFSNPQYWGMGKAWLWQNEMDLNRRLSPSALHFFVLEIEMEIGNQPPTSHSLSLPRSLPCRFGMGRKFIQTFHIISFELWALRSSTVFFSYFFSIIESGRQYKIVISLMVVPHISHAISKIQNWIKGQNYMQFRVMCIDTADCLIFMVNNDALFSVLQSIIM